MKWFYVRNHFNFRILEKIGQDKTAKATDTTDNRKQREDGSAWNYSRSAGNCSVRTVRLAIICLAVSWKRKKWSQVEQYQHVNGIILRSRDYKEADQLLTVYTREQGKITVQARGVKKTASRLRSGILLFSHTSLVLTAGKAFPIVTGASTETAFPLLRSDFTRMSYASYAAELLDQVIADSQPDEDLFVLILQTMYLLENINPWLAVRHLELRLLELQGYGIQLEHCLQCGAPLHGDRFYGVQGGVLCRICSHGQQGGSALTQEALAVLKAFSYIPMHRLGWVHISGEGRQSLEQYLELQLQQVLSWRLKSRDFLKNMNL